MESSRKQPSFFKRVRYVLEFSVVATFAAFIRVLPRPAVLALADVVGWIAYAVLWHDRRVAHANLDIVLGDARTRSEKRRIVRRSFQRLAATLTGLFWAPRLTPERAGALVEGDDLRKVFDDLAARGKGVVIVTAHYGDWELLCYAGGLLGYPALMVTEPMPNRRIEAMLARLRGGSGNRTVPPRYAVLKLMRELKAGGRVAVMTDVNGRRGRGGVWLDFFGLQVFNGAALAELALRTGAAVVFVAARPLPGGRIRQVCWPPIEFTPTEDHAADVRVLSQQVLDCCRDLIRDDPEPWLWTYKRWKRRPAEERGEYPFYSKYASEDAAAEEENPKHEIRVVPPDVGMKTRGG